MDESNLIHGRMDQILRDRIKYGMYGGEDGGYISHKAAVARAKKGWRTRRAHGEGTNIAGGRRRRVVRRGRGEGEGYGTRRGALKGWRTRRARGEGEAMMGVGFDEGMYGGKRRRSRRSGSKSSKGGAIRSPWIKFVKHFAQKHHLPYKIALEEAGPAYHKMMGSSRY